MSGYAAFEMALECVYLMLFSKLNCFFSLISPTSVLRHKLVINSEMQTFACLQLGSILVTGTQPALTCALMYVPPLYLSVITIYTAQRLCTCSFSSPPPSSSEVTQQQKERHRAAVCLPNNPWRKRRRLHRYH